MVRCTSLLLRVPMIKFRKGGIGISKSQPSSAVPSADAGGCPIGGSAQAQSAATISTAIPDIDLPPRYRRQPLSQEEIDHINGGGIA